MSFVYYENREYEIADKAFKSLLRQQDLCVDNPTEHNIRKFLKMTINFQGFLDKYSESFSNEFYLRRSEQTKIIYDYITTFLNN